MNYFSLLNLPESFTLDSSTLETVYFTAQRRFHPDRFVGKSEGERLAAAQKSADINQAYEILKNPLKRAQHVLALQGIMVGTDHDSVKPSQELLMEVMEWREEPQRFDLAKLKEESINRIGNHFQAQQWNAMAQETLRLGYIVKAM